jgi:hypothetical protein
MPGSEGFHLKTRSEDSFFPRGQRKERRSGRRQVSVCVLHGLRVLVHMVKYRHHRPFTTCSSAVTPERRAIFAEIDFSGYINV